MKYLKYLVLVLSLLFIYNVGSRAKSIEYYSYECSSSDTIVKYVYVRDTVFVNSNEKPLENKLSDSLKIIRTKAVGRFDRRITNFCVVPKGKWIGGITASVYNFEADDSRLLFSLMKDIDLRLKYLSVHPFVGYAVSDNTVVGLKFGYSKILGDLGNFSMSIEGLDIDMSNVKYTNDLYSYDIFYRSYIGMDSKGIFGLFNETTLGYNTGTARFSQGEGEDLKYTDSKINQLSVGINPGIVVFIMPNVGAEISFGVAGFTYNWENQKKSNGETGKRTNSGANFKINLLNINIGLIIRI